MSFSEAGERETLPEREILDTTPGNNPGNTNINPPRSSSTTQENSSTRVVTNQIPLEKVVKGEVVNRGRD